MEMNSFMYKTGPTTGSPSQSIDPRRGGPSLQTEAQLGRSSKGVGGGETGK